MSKDLQASLLSMSNDIGKGIFLQGLDDETAWRRRLESTRYGRPVSKQRTQADRRTELVGFLHR